MNCASCGQREDWCRCDKWCQVCGGDTNHTTRQHIDAMDTNPVLCRECHEGAVKDEDRTCGECLSEMAEMYAPDGGGEA